MAFAVVVALFALAGPFGTYQALDFPARLGYWLITQAVTWCIALCAISLCGAIAGTSPFKSVWTVLAGAALAAVPIALAVEVIGLAVFNRPVTIAGLGRQTVITLPLSMLLGLFAYLVVRPVPDVQSATAASDNRLLRRLSPANRGKVLYLSMHDHYVEVVTSKGSELILLRFNDALDELDGGDGHQIHRSHWVAASAVAGWRRENGKLFLEMSDGVELPVSRSYAKAVRSAGLLAD
ncbi:MAG: LytTR family DNA-binding domain-containing protein [Aestuariivirgaceae bacterium]